jgi:hypothetical protein
VLRTFAGGAVIDVVTVAKDEVIARAAIPVGLSAPTFVLSERGDVLIAHDWKAGKLYRFDPPGKPGR